MKQMRRNFPRFLRLLALTAALGASIAWADDYADITQLLKAGKPTEALSKTEERLTANARDPQLRFLRGVAQADAGKQADAITTFTQLTQDYPELPEPYNNLAVLYANQNQLDKARTALEMAIRTNPSYATAHENLGDIYAKLASQAYTKALQLDTGNAAAIKPKLSLIREMFSSNGQPKATPPAPATAPVPTGKLQESAPSSDNKPTAAAPAKQPTTETTAKSAATAAAPPAPQPQPAPTQAADTASPEAVQEATAAVHAWATAWAAQDMKAYLAAYDSTFDPPGRKSRAEWEKERHARIVGKKDISVKLSQLTVTVHGDKAQARFRQTYRSNALDSNTRKTLDLVRHGDRWTIVREAVGG